MAAQQDRRTGGWSVDSSLEELALLCRTAGAQVVGKLVQRREHPSPQHYLGKGKIEEIKALRAESKYNVVVVDDELTPYQQHNLEESLEVKIIDRTALILDIFAQRARTKEGRLQVELAQHQYLLPRLAGQWAHLERLGGGIGTRGPGESQLETDRRIIRRKIQKLKAEIESIRKHRALYQQQRLRAGIPVVAVVGYTNAGKSTLFNALCHADVFVENKLFATLDPTTRRLHLPNYGDVLLTDTVGFIQKLPATLVAAFHATLEELETATILLHVVDVTHKDAELQRRTVESVLSQLGLSQKPVIVAFNKVDLVNNLPDAQLSEHGIEVIRRDMAYISAVTGSGLPRLLDMIESRLSEAGRPAVAPSPVDRD
ncbi:MAG: GTPase HflX [Chloroflexi bacterium]|nr:GTPase HflX [Chloroflexota bacterium]